MESKNKDTYDPRASSSANVSCALSSKPAGVVGQLTGSFGNSSVHEESSLSSLDGKSIITMLWGLIAFYKGILEAKTTTTDAKSVIADPLHSDEFDALYSELSRISLSHETEAIKRKKLEMKITKKDACISELELDLEEARSADAHKQLALERLVVRHLSQRLEETTAENAQLKTDMDLLKHGHLKSMDILRTSLNEFIALCLRLPFGSKESRLYAAFEDFEARIESMIGAAKECVASALFVSRNEEARNDLVSEEDDEDNHRDIVSMSEREAKEELVRSRRKKEKFAKATNKKIINNLRRVREMSLKVKNTEETLAHVLAENQLQKDNLLQEISRLRRMLKERQLVWQEGHYKVAESMRSFVEQLQKLGQELFVEKEQLEERVAALIKENSELQERNGELTDGVDRLKREALNEAKKAMKEQLDELAIRNQELTNESQRLQSMVEEFKEGESGAKQAAEEHVIMRKKLEAMQINLEAKAKEINALRRENSALKTAQANTKDQFLSSHNGFVARTSSRRSADELMAKSLPYSGSAEDSGLGRGSLLNSWRLEPTRGPQSLASSHHLQGKQLMQCLKCSVRFPVAAIEDYEQHIRTCYNVKPN